MPIHINLAGLRVNNYKVPGSNYIKQNLRLFKISGMFEYTARKPYASKAEKKSKSDWN